MSTEVKDPAEASAAVGGNRCRIVKPYQAAYAGKAMRDRAHRGGTGDLGPLDWWEAESTAAPGSCFVRAGLWPARSG